MCTAATWGDRRGQRIGRHTCNIVSAVMQEDGVTVRLSGKVLCQDDIHGRVRPSQQGSVAAHPLPRGSRGNCRQERVPDMGAAGFAVQIVAHFDDPGQVLLTSETTI
jgi:hypothetical protein